MALYTMPLQWFDKLSLGSIRGWKDLQRSFCENFASIITHPITHAELKWLKQKGGKSLRDYYHWFGELCAQVHDITEREVIKAFSHRIMDKWQFQDFCKENPRNNEEFRHTVEKWSLQRRKHEKGSRIETTETTRTRAKEVTKLELAPSWVFLDLDESKRASKPTLNLSRVVFTLRMSAR
jgi:hypothetical protein